MDGLHNTSEQLFLLSSDELWHTLSLAVVILMWLNTIKFVYQGPVCKSHWLNWCLRFCTTIKFIPKLNISCPVYWYVFAVFRHYAHKHKHYVHEKVILLAFSSWTLVMVLSEENVWEYTAWSFLQAICPSCVSAISVRAWRELKSTDLKRENHSLGSSLLDPLLYS